MRLDTNYFVFERFIVSLIVTRMPANFFIAWLDVNLIEHILSPQRFGNTFGFVFGQRMIRIDARDFENPLIDTHDTERTKRHTRRNLNVVDVVNLEVAGLLDPVLDKW